MNDDALPAIWMSDTPPANATVKTAVQAVLDADRAVREKDRAIRVASVLVLALLCPALIWCAAHGISPLVRGGYALMAVGTALLIATEWTYLTWSRQGLPGPADARSQLLRSTFLLARQVSLMRMAPMWCAPVFIGTALIGLWLYQERSATEGSLLWAALAAGWIVASVGGIATGTKLDAQRRRMEQLLADLA